MNSVEMQIINPKNNVSYLLRDMTADDVVAVLAIENVAQLHPWSVASFQSSLDSSHQCYVVEGEGGLVAYAVVSTAADEAELLNITVSPSEQRQGIGHLLLTYLSDSFDKSIATFFLEVRRSNTHAIALYDAHYFNEVGMRTNYYPTKDGAREDAIIMAKSLSF